VQLKVCAGAAALLAPRSFFAAGARKRSLCSREEQLLSGRSGMSFAVGSGMKPQILVGFDFSTAAHKAMEWAADLQRTVQGKPFHAIFVINPLPSPVLPETASLGILSAEEIDGYRRSLAAAVKKVSEAATSEVVLSGAPGAAILETARMTKADLIVLGTHGRGALSRLFAGSVAEYVLRHANVPVLTIREAAEAARRADGAGLAHSEITLGGV
jgi:nucleotide-binding universal stress UspA family protein